MMIVPLHEAAAPERLPLRLSAVVCPLCVLCKGGLFLVLTVFPVPSSSNPPALVKAGVPVWVLTHVSTVNCATPPLSHFAHHTPCHCPLLDPHVFSIASVLLISVHNTQSRAHNKAPTAVRSVWEC